MVTRVKRITIISIIAALAVIAIVVPIAVVFVRKRNMKLDPFVLVPLYIYPNLGAWDPLYEAVSENPDIDFTVIVNPQSGPGSSQYPSNLYVSAIQNLTGFRNVKTIGYVPTTYATRDINAVLKDIQTYSGWSSYTNSRNNRNNRKSIAVSGIFFDESPHNYTPEATQYLKTINKAVKAATGLQNSRTVIHNPGVVPDSRLVDSQTDITVVFEESYGEYNSRKASLETLPNNRAKYSYLVHSIPSQMTGEALGDFVRQLSQRAKYLYLTSNEKEYYQAFGSAWGPFIESIGG